MPLIFSHFFTGHGYACTHSGASDIRVFLAVLWESASQMCVAGSTDKVTNVLINVSLARPFL